MDPPRKHKSVDNLYADGGRQRRRKSSVRDTQPSKCKSDIVRKGSKVIKLSTSSPNSNGNIKSRSSSRERRPSSRERRPPGPHGSSSMRHERSFVKQNNNHSSSSKKNRSKSVEPSSPSRRSRSSSRGRRLSSVDSPYTKQRSTVGKKLLDAPGAVSRRKSERKKSKRQRDAPPAKKIGSFRPYHVPIKKHMSYRKKSKQVQEPTTTNNNNNNNNDTKASPNMPPPPAVTLYDAMKTISVAHFLHEGIPVLKVSHSNPKKKWQRRILTLSHDQTSLFLTHSKVKPNTTRAQVMSPNSKHIPSWTPTKGWAGTYLRAIDMADIHFWQVGVVSSRAMERSLPYQKHVNPMALTQSPKDAAKNAKTKSSKPKKSLWGDASFDPTTVGAIVTIFYTSQNSSSGVETLDLAIENQDHRRALVATLALLKKTHQETSQMIGNETLLLRYIWKDMDLSQQNMVNEREFATICHRLQWDPPTSKEYKAFCKEIHDERKKTGTHTSKSKNCLTMPECMRMLQRMKQTRQGGSSPALDAWKACFGNANSVNAKTVLTKLLHGPQKEQATCDLDDAEDLIAATEATELGEVQPESKALNQGKLTKPHFEAFLKSEWNDIYDPEKKLGWEELGEDALDRPISHYWINSSQSSFLMAPSETVNILDGSSKESFPFATVQAVAMALEKGVKSLDLSCCDGPEPAIPEDPVIPMVGVADSETIISFHSVIMVILRFVKTNPNSLPICINIENHCTQPFQVQMAKTMKTVLGNHLFVPSSIHRSKQLPSLDELLGLIVFNLKRGPSDDGDMAKKDNYQATSGVWTVEQTGGSDVYAEMFQKFNTPVKPTSTDMDTFLPESGILSSAEAQAMKKKGGDGSDTQGYANELLSLTMFHDASFTGFFEDSLDLMCSHMHTIDDTRVQKIAIKYENNPKLWRKFGEDHLTRIVPKAKNDDVLATHNFNPVFAWSMGCQITNINLHATLAADRNIALNAGMFQQTGGGGFIEKPHSLLDEDDKPASKKLKIRILSGSCLPRPFMRKKDDTVLSDSDTLQQLSVQLELHDVQVTGNRNQEKFAMTSHKVKCMGDNGNGFAPIFYDKGKDFVVETPDVAMLLFQVMDTDFGVVGMAAIPVNCLRRGYRSVQLYNQDGTRHGPYAFATLLVYLQCH